jgi:hypothetical protein
MQPSHSHIRASALVLAAALALVTAARATEQDAITNAAGAASAASAPTAVRTMKFTTHHAVPATLTSRRNAAISDGWKAQFRFAGQTDLHDCVFHLPKSGQLLQRGETAIGTIVCTTPWQLYDNGLAFQALQSGKKVADGTLRP